MEKAYIVYNRRSSATARNLHEIMQDDETHEWRLISNKRFKYKPRLVLRWGNSYLDVPDGTIELNRAEAVGKATDKLKMALTLSSAEGVLFPRVRFFGDNAPRSTMSEEEYNAEIRSGGLYFRNEYDHVSFRRGYIHGDKYATKKVDRAREYRVHIFDESTIGVYEKIPEDENQLILKDDNSQFRRIDVSNRDAKRMINGVRPMARLAVSSLGLLFGGVDIVVARNGSVYVIEVNSAPSLNEPNLDRWKTAIQSYIATVIRNES